MFKASIGVIQKEDFLNFISYLYMWREIQKIYQEAWKSNSNL